MTPYKKIKIKTPRLVLRPYTAKDFESWAESLRGSLPQQNKYDIEKPKNRVINRREFKLKLNRHAAMAARDETYIFGIFSRKTGEHFGAVDLHLYQRRDLHWANLGYRIINQYWGHRYGREAAKATLKLGFKHLGLHRIEAATELDNRASLKLARGIGMIHEGIRKEFLPTQRGWKDLIVFASVKK